MAVADAIAKTQRELEAALAEEAGLEDMRQKCLRVQLRLLEQATACDGLVGEVNKSLFFFFRFIICIKLDAILLLTHFYLFILLPHTP